MAATVRYSSSLREEICKFLTENLADACQYVVLSGESKAPFSFTKTGIIVNYPEYVAAAKILQDT